MPTPARQLALRLLLEVERGRATLGDLLAQDAPEALDVRERAFLHELVLGTLRRRGALDHALLPLLDRPLERVDAPVLAALRLGAYQIAYLRVPDRAAVSESVDLVRASHPRAAGLVNAVLRRLARDGPPAFPDPRLQPLEWLTSEGSLPRWLAERWLARLGPDDAVRRARACLEPPPLVFRLNPRVADAAERAVAAGLAPKALALPGALQSESGRTAELARAGVLYVHDQGSQLVAHLSARPGLVLDACAAPGGKATLIADLLGDRGRVVAAEASRRRLRLLSALVERWGASGVRVVGADARFPPFVPGFDAVLLDAPCSGLGTLARNPDLRWRVRPEDVQRQARRQQEMLAALAPLVKAGGRLVYATCSLEPEENEDVVAGFLAATPAFTPDPLPGWATPFAFGAFARTCPERDGGDGFCAAPLRRGHL